MINYYCPDFYKGRKIYELVFDYKKKYGYIFNDNVNISRIFGAFPSMIWNGGAVSVSKKIFPAEIVDARDFYEANGVTLQLTLTNFSLMPSHLNDEYCNQVLDLLNNGKHEVLVASNLMEDYIKKNYKNYKVVRSIVNSKNYDNLLEDLKSNRYSTGVLPKRFIKDFNYLNSIDKDLRSRLEILCNDPCPYDCPYEISHYEKFNELNIRQGANVYDALSCQNKRVIDSPFYKLEESHISFNDIVNLYNSIGYTEFKLAGRGSLGTITDNVLRYMIRPEYQLDLNRQIIVNTL